MLSGSFSPSRLPPIWFGVVTAASLAWLTWPLYGLDTRTFLLPWLAHIRAAGPIGAFAQPFANYTPPYLYLMAAVSPLAAVLPAPAVLKLLSFACHALLALALRQLLVAAGHDRPGRAAALIVLAPTLFVSPAILVQCDALWAAALVMALAAAVERRHAAMFAWCGLAVAIKAQAAFAGPFFLALALARGVPFHLWLAAPAAMVAAMLPAWCAGWPAADLLTIYLHQSQWSEGIALNAPTIWMIAQQLAAGDGARWTGIALAIAGAACIAYVALIRRPLASADPVMLLHVACLCALIVPGLLPRMHERYFFLSDVLALAIVAMRPTAWRLAALTQLGSGLAILAYLSGIEGLASIGAAAMLSATWLLGAPFVPDRRRAAMMPAAA